MFKRRFKVIKQHDMKDCGPACLAMVCFHYGLKQSIARIRELAGTDLQGTTMKGMAEAAARLGFEACGVEAETPEALQEIPLPAIAHVMTDDGFNHYAVIYKVSKEKVWVADPSVGRRAYSAAQFWQRWTGVLLLLEPGETFQPGNETTPVFQRFLQLLKPQAKLLAPLFFISMLFNVLGLLGAFYFRLLIDDIVPNESVQFLHALSLAIVTLYIFRALLSYVRNHMILHFNRRLEQELELGFFRHVIHMPMHFFETRKTGEIISRMSDAGHVRDALSSSMVTLMIDALMVILGTILLYLQSPFLFGIALMLVPFYILSAVLFHKPYTAINHKQMESSAKLTSYMVESFHGIATVKSYNAEQAVLKQTESRFMEMLDNVFKQGKLFNFQASMQMGLELIGSTVILWVGAVQVLEGSMTLGQLITFSALMSYFLDPILNLIQLQPEMQSAVVAAERLNEILDLKTELAEQKQAQAALEHLKVPIEMRDVTFRYGSRAPVLKQINFKIEPGTLAAFVGKSGSGKTTIAKLLVRFYDPEAGNIYFGDRPAKEIDRTALRARIAYASQESFFFNGTIYDNLCFGLEEAPPLKEVIHAAKLAQAHGFISKMPMQYGTMLEENGANLSGGQKQRLAIARALLKKPDVLLLDEAASQLDAQTEAAVIDQIAQLCREQCMTVILITHRLSTLRHADQIFVLENGKLMEQGTHAELVSQKGKYVQLLMGHCQ